MAMLKVLLRGALLLLLLPAITVIAQPEESEEVAEVAEAEGDTTEVIEAAEEKIDWDLPDGTEVSGDVSGYWSAGIYRVKDVLTVPAGDSLYIAAGCTLYFDGPIDRTKLHINSLGYLSITGTESTPVLMASALPPGDPNRIWGGILYVGNQAEGRVAHTIFKQAEIGVQVREGVRVESTAEAEEGYEADSTNQLPPHILARPTGPVVISNCTIDSASFNGIVLVGVDSSVVVEKSRIEYCSSGISVDNNANPIIRDVLLLNNYSAGVICSNNASPDLYNVTIIGSQTAGIICSNNSNPTITESVIAKCGIGISATGSNPVVRYCTIAKNDFSGIIAYDNALPQVSSSSMRDNGLSGIDNRSNGMITADRVWWGYIATDSRPEPTLYAARRRELEEPVAEGVNGTVTATNTLDSPSHDAPGTPDRATSMVMSPNRDMSTPFSAGASVSNGDSIYIRLVAVDESPYLEDQAQIIITSSSGDPEGIERVLNESGPNTGTYEGFIIASLLPGDPNTVVEVANGDIIRVESGTNPPFSASITFVSEPPIISRLRVNGKLRGAPMIDPTPTFTWLYVDPEGDAQSATQIELSSHPLFEGDPVWKLEETGRLVEYTYDGPPLERGTTYYAHVRAHDGYNWGRWRQSDFHMNIAPPTPTPAYPEDGITIRSMTGKPAVGINNVEDNDGDPVSYIFEAYYGEDYADARLRARGGGEPVQADTIAGTTRWVNMPTLWENSQIWWRAKATDGLEESEWSEPRSFLLNAKDDPPMPFSMLEPRPDSTVYTIHPRLEWEFSYDPDPESDLEFVVTFARDSLFTRTSRTRRVASINEAIQYYQVPPEDTLLDNEYYFWKVRAEQDGETVLIANDTDPTLSEVWRFFVDTGNDPPQVRYVPDFAMTEDTPHRVKMRQYISDADNTIDQLQLTARSTQHVNAEVTGHMEVTLTPEPDWEGGPETIRLEVKDPLKSIGIGEIRVTVRGTNDTPVTSEIPAQRVAEDTDLRLDLNTYVRDIDNRIEDMRWRADYDRNKLQVEIARGIATIRGTPDFAGENVPIRFTATDLGNLSSTTTAQVTINAQNDAPRVTQIPPVVFDEDASATVRLDRYVSDPDNPNSSLKWAARPDEPLSIEIDPASHVARISAPKNFGGVTRRAVFVVRDPSGLENQIVAKIEVRAVNDPPVIAAISPKEFSEDESLRLDMDQFVSDPDNSSREMVWTASGGRNIQSVIEAGTRRVVFSAPVNWYGGPETITLTARDPGGLTARQTVAVSVNPVAEAPRFKRIPEVVFNEDGSTVLALDDYLSDPDHPNPRLTVAVTPPSNVATRLDAGTRRITLSAPRNWNGGPETVTVQATDPDNERTTTTFTVRVTPVNDPPTLSAIPAASFNEDMSTSITLTDYVSDPDNPATQMTWTFSGQTNVRASVTGGVATFGSALNWNGSERLTVTATDPGGLSAKGTVNITVAPVNDPPTLTTIPAVEFDEDGGTSTNLARYVNDVDNSKAQLTWRASGGQNVSVAISGGTATFSAALNWFGVERITFAVTDPGGLEASGATQVTVNKVNDPPTISAIPGQRFEEDGTTSIDLAPYGSDIDGDALSWSAQSGDRNVTARVTGTTLALSSARDWSGGPVNVTVAARDIGGLTANGTVGVTVTPVNDPPTLTAIPAVSFDEDKLSALNLAQYVNDVDTPVGQLTWTASGGQNVSVTVSGSRVAFSSAVNWHGTERISFTVRDPGGLEATGGTQVTVNAVNDPPSVSAIPAQRFDEDGSTSIDLAPYGSDIDGDALSWSVRSTDRSLTARVTGSTLTLSSAANWSGGPIGVAVSASDRGGLSANGTVNVTVSPVNDPPILRSIPAVAFDEDQSSSLNLTEYVSDVDTPVGQLTWTASGGQSVSVTFTGGRAAFNSTANWSGTERISFTVRDPGGLEASGTTQVTVKAVNDAPTISAIPAQRFAEDENTTVDLAPHGSDIDGDALRWSVSSPNRNVKASVQGSLLTLSSAVNWSGGPVSVAVSATDRGGLSANSSVSVSVTPVNDPPTLRTITPVAFDEDGSTSLNLGQFVSDADNSAGELTWRTSGGQSVTMSTAGATANFSAASNWHGSETINVTVSDPGGLNASGTVKITVRSVNDPPTVNEIEAQRFEEDRSTTVDLTPYGSDPDGDALTWSATSGNRSVTARVAGTTLTLGAAANWSGGPATVTVKATDAGRASAQTAVSVTVTPVNDPPTISAIPAVRFAEDGTSQLNLNRFVSDVDGETGGYQWTATGNHNVTIRMSGTSANFGAPANWSGSEQITFTVRDPGGLEASGSTQVTVTPVNDPPTLTSASPVAFDEDGSSTVDLSQIGSDPDGETLRWLASSPNRNIQTTVSGSTLNLSSVANWSGGPVSVAITATDPARASVNGTISVTVRAVNDPPTLAAIPAVTFDEDGSGSVTLSEYVRDVDDDAAGLTWSASGSQNVTVRVSGGVASIGAPTDWNGSEQATLTVTDRAGGKASQPIRITVRPVNDPPKLGQPSPVTMNEDATTTVDLGLVASDPDGEALTYTATSGDPNVQATVSGSTLSLSATQNWSGGPVSIAISAIDQGGTEVSGTLPVTVRPVNDEPTLRGLPSVRFDEDGNASLGLAEYVSDVEDEPTEMSWSASGGQNVRVNFSGASGSFSVAENWHGSESVTISVRDRGGATRSQTVQVTVNPVNDDPVASAQPVSVKAGAWRATKVDISGFATDADGDALTWQYVDQTGSLTVELSGTELRIKAPRGSTGTSVLTLTVSDGKGGEGTLRLSVNITN
jgi:hypothetical protein